MADTNELRNRRFCSQISKYATDGVHTMTVGSEFVDAKDASKKSTDGKVASVLWLLFFCALHLNTVIRYIENETRQSNEVYSICYGLYQIGTRVMAVILLLIIMTKPNKYSWIQCQRVTSPSTSKRLSPKLQMVGVMIFGTGNIILKCFAVYELAHCAFAADQEGEVERLEYGFRLVTDAVAIIAIAVQMRFLYNMSEDKYKYHNHPGLRFAFMYIISINVYVYMYNLGLEIVESEKDGEKDASLCNLNNNAGFLPHLYPYLTPFVMEYNLLATEIMIHTWVHMGYINNESNGENSIEIPEGVSFTQGGSVSNNESTPLLHGSADYGNIENENENENGNNQNGIQSLSSLTRNREENYAVAYSNVTPDFRLWMVPVLLLFLSYIIFSILRSADKSNPDIIGYLFLSSGTVMYSLSIIVLLRGLFHLPPGVSTIGGMDTLLMIVATGYFTYTSYRTISYWDCITNSVANCSIEFPGNKNNERLQKVSFIGLVIYVLKAIIIWTQTLFIIHGTKQTLDQKLSTKSATALMQTTLFLVVFNFVMWVRTSFLIEATKNGIMVKSQITQILLPFVIFYHFQCTVTLVDYFFSLRKAIRNGLTVACIRARADGNDSLNQDVLERH